MTNLTKPELFCYFTRRFGRQFLTDFAPPAGNNGNGEAPAATAQTYEGPSTSPVLRPHCARRPSHHCHAPSDRQIRGTAAPVHLRRSRGALRTRPRSVATARVPEGRRPLRISSQAVP